MTSTTHQKNINASLVYYLLGIMALGGIFASMWWTYTPIISGFTRLQDYANLSWAHESLLLKTLLNTLVMVWLLASAFFWGGWLLHRSVRKIKGQQWHVHLGANQLGANPKAANSTVSVFFPPVLRYLKYSCGYLVVILLFVILQYPLQFLIFQ